MLIDLVFSSKFEILLAVTYLSINTSPNPLLFPIWSISVFVILTQRLNYLRNDWYGSLDVNISLITWKVVSNNSKFIVKVDIYLYNLFSKNSYDTDLFILALRFKIFDISSL